MTMPKVMSIVSLLALSAVPSTSLAEGSADEHLMQIVAAYTREALDRGSWENPFLPAAAAGDLLAAVAPGDGVTIAGPFEESADRQMAAIVADYTRVALDRGGWENAYLPGVALGNQLARVTVGSGTTITASEVVGAAGREPSAKTR